MPKENEDGQEKTERPTARKLNKAKSEGQVAKSQEVNSAAVMIAGVTALFFFGGAMLNRITTLMKWVWGDLGNIQVDIGSFPFYMQDGAKWMFMTLIPVLATIAVVGVVANLAQSGWIFTTKPLQPKFDKINPVKGAKRMLNQRAWVKLLTNIIKIAIIGFIAYKVVKAAFPQFIPLMDMEVPEIFVFLMKTILKLMIWLLFALLLIAVVDFIYQKYKYTQDMKMTKQEVKDERKMSEGDPQVKGKIRQMQFQFAFNRMIKELPNADVIVTNPVHVAIALRYDATNMAAPVVLGKGLRKLAEKIKRIARENNIPIVENPPLARALYKNCRIGDEIPGQFYQDIAEILAYIYKLKGDPKYAKTGS